MVLARPTKKNYPKKARLNRDNLLLPFVNPDLQPFFLFVFCFPHNFLIIVWSGGLLVIPGQGILQENAGEENCVKDREAPAIISNL